MPETELKTATPDPISNPDLNKSVAESNPKEGSAVVANQPVEQYPNPEVKRDLSSELAKYFLSAIILAAGIGMAVGLSLLKKDPGSQDPKELDLLVRTVQVEPIAGELELTVSGSVVAYREIRVASEIAGRISKKNAVFEAGNFVKKGTPLIEIDPLDYQLQLDTRKAEVEQAEKSLLENEEEVVGAQRNQKLAEREFELAKKDFERNAKIRNSLSDTEMMQAEKSLLAAELTVTSRQNTLGLLTAKKAKMEAALKLAKANLKRAELNLQKTVVVAPDDGVIVSEMVQEGDYVRAGDTILTFEDTSQSEVLCNLTPTDLKWIIDNSPAGVDFVENNDNENPASVYYLPKSRVSIYEPGEEEIVWEGVLERFNGVGQDADSRTVPTRISVKDPIVEHNNQRRALVRGMFVKCKIRVRTSTENEDQSFVAIPAIAVAPGNVVWTVVDGKLKKREIEIVHSIQNATEDGGEVFIAREMDGAIKKGDQIVVTPMTLPADDKKVIVAKGSETDFESESNSESVTE
ncbi:MAG: HlyD family efflux transporter periplasmic adaptor subunit [Planctomycetota bacterium]